MAADATTLLAETGTVEVGWLLLIDSERLFVSAVSTGVDNDTLTVRRAQFGTTAAAHSNGTTIYRYCPPSDVEKAVADLAKFLYQRQEGGAIQSEKMGDYAVTYQGVEMPKETADTIRHYARLDYGSL